MARFTALLTSLFILCNEILLFQTASGMSIGDKERLKALLRKRIVPTAPDGYAPAEVDCPSSRPSIRNANELSPQESSWLDQRRPNTVQPMRDLFSRLNIPGFDSDAFFESNSNNISALPNIALAASGGGYRALTNGAGVIAAFDDRTSDSTSNGGLGGLLQSATYFSGLSGGSWLVSSLYLNNFTSVQDLVNGLPGEGNVWDFTTSIVEGPDEDGLDIFNTADYYVDLYDQVDSKDSAGFQTSLTDYWGRALSYQLVNAPNGGPGYTWSGLAKDPRITLGNAPLPIVVADGRKPGEMIIPGNATIYEFNPWEMGSWDISVYGFAPLEYVGSKFNRGTLPEDEACISGFDSASFVFGTSSSLFNQFILNLNTVDIPSFIKDAIRDVLSNIGDDNDDIAEWKPNPFHNFDPSFSDAATDAVTDSSSLYLVDGGENLENIPLHPLIQPARQIDVIFAIDSSADTTTFWPNGASLVATYQRSLNATTQNGTAFPVIPDQNTFINKGYNVRPTFFGCDAANATNADVAPFPAPVIVYLPNTPYEALSNVSTFQMSYSTAQRNAIVTNGYDVATQANATLDRRWPVCVGCAVMRRAWERAGDEFPAACRDCFDAYCWDGSTDPSEPPAPFAPEPLGSLIKTGDAPGLRASAGLSVAVAAAVAVGMAVLA